MAFGGIGTVPNDKQRQSYILIAPPSLLDGIPSSGLAWKNIFPSGGQWHILTRPPLAWGIGQELCLD